MPDTVDFERPRPEHSAARRGIVFIHGLIYTAPDGAAHRVLKNEKKTEEHPLVPEVIG